MTATAIFESFKTQKVLIIGDVMIDRYLTGSVSRISPEAPVPVVLHKNTDNRLGGAANVALNVKALGGTPILCSVIGNDADGAIFIDTLQALGIETDGILQSENRKTTVKTRILGNHQQMLRIDQEDTHDLTPEEESQLLALIQEMMDTQGCSVAILQDYNKGVLTPTLIGQTIQMAKSSGIPTAVDPKKQNFFAYRGVDLFKPNLKEIRDSAPFPIQTDVDSLEKAALFLAERLENHLTMITLSEKGLFLYDGKKGEIFPTKTRNVSDVSGAGDTVISVAAMGLALGLDLNVIAALSNLAGGQVCGFTGVVPVKPDLLRQEFEIFAQL